ncbi:MAG: DUF3821 domain-containing protein, partial [Methanoregula sp.]
MTKRLTIALIAVALFVLMAVMPVSAYTPMFANGTIINQGATVFIGEQGLNVTHALNDAYYGASCGAVIPCGEDNTRPVLTTIGWWASAADIYNSAPSKTIDLSTRYYNFMVAPSDFVGYTGNWYLLDANGRAYSAFNNPDITVPDTCGCTLSSCIASLVFTVADPSLDMRIWDYTTNNDVTGKSVPQGEKLGFRIDTNMYTAVNNDNLRNNVIGNTYDTCGASGNIWYNYSVNTTICYSCGQFVTTVYNISTTGEDGVGWLTWAEHPGTSCFMSNSTPIYYVDGIHYP